MKSILNYEKSYSIYMMIIVIEKNILYPYTTSF